MIRIISATRLSSDEFWKNSALGHSLRRLAYDSRLVARVAFSNQLGLPDVYNAGISAAEESDLLVFVHDDVWIDDYFFADRVTDGLERFDVIGVAGNRRRVERQPSWAFVDSNLTWDDRAHLSGAVAHGKFPFGAVSHFGAAPAACELLDGLFLAARSAALKGHGVQFDPRFDFHFYDMDFCRSARQRGLRLGTWPICLTHQSGGAFGNPKWARNHEAYLDKWGD